MRSRLKIAHFVLCFSLYDCQCFSETNFSESSSNSQTADKVRGLVVKQPRFVFAHKDRVDGLVCSPDGKTIASFSVRDGIKLSDMATGRLLRTLEMRGYSANSMVFSQNGRMLATGNNDGNVRLWDTQTLQLKTTISVCHWSIYSVALSPDNRTLASCAADGTVQIWDVKEGKRLLTLGKKGERMSSMSFSADGRQLATLSRYARADLWEMTTGRLLGTLPGKGSGSQCSVSICDSSKIFVVASEDGILFWEPQNAKKVRSVPLPESLDPFKKMRDRKGPAANAVSELIFLGFSVVSPDCNKVASLGQHGDIAIWAAQTRKVERTLLGSRIPNLFGGGVEMIMFCPDSRSLVVGNSNGQVEVWDVR